MKRPLLFTAAVLACVALHAQVRVDRPVELNAADPALRTVEGLAPAENVTGMIDANGAQSGRYHWGQATGTGMVIQLSLTPAANAYANGMEVRFLPIAAGYGSVTVNVNGLGARRIYRSDGLPVSIGQLTPGTLATMVYADTAFFISGRATQACPEGYLPVNGQYCIQRNDTANFSIFNATRWCNDRGARLCTWGEYIHACNVQQSAMEGMFDDWEWVDDTSDHTHSSVQVGRWVCHSQRNFGAVEDGNNNGRVRCCLTVK